MADTVADFISSGRRSSGRRRSERLPGTAEDGVFVPTALLEIAGARPLDRSVSPGDGLSLEDPQRLLRGAERDAYDHLTGLLLDTTISGVISKEYLYLDSSLNGEILADDGTVYEFSVSDTFVSFTSQGADEQLHAEGFVETDGDQLESSQISKLFHQVSGERVLKDAWSSRSGLSAVSGVTFGSIEMANEYGVQTVSLPVETCFGEWSIELSGQQSTETLSYSVTDLDRNVVLTRRTADAVLSDIAEACGKIPDPAHVLEAMVTVAAAVSARRGLPQAAMLLS